MGETEVLFDVAVLGKQVDEFMRSDVGRYILDRLERESTLSIEALKIANCNQPKAIQKLQNDIWRAASLKTWLEEAVMAGLKAKDILEERE